jgi:hypothetical protein
MNVTKSSIYYVREEFISNLSLFAFFDEVVVNMISCLRELIATFAKAFRSLSISRPCMLISFSLRNNHLKKS